MYELKKNGKIFTSKSVGTGPSSYEKRIYRAAVSQILRDTGVHLKFNGFILLLIPQSFNWLPSEFVASHSFHCCITVSSCVSGDVLYIP